MRIIAHLDMDAFYASVEERDSPRFRGHPLAVGADPDGGKGRGVVTTANYPARAYGIHSAMPISTAWRLSEIAKSRGNPPVVFVSVDMEKYRGVSARVMEILRRFAPTVEEAGIDEAFLDLSFTGSFEKAEEIGRDIKKAILEAERLTASIGLGPNKLIAKIASDRQKPDGLTVVRAEDAEAFLASLPVRRIPGIGPKSELAFAKEGVRLISDLTRFSRHELQERLGKRGLEVYDRARGQDERPVDTTSETKSISEQETFARDSLDSGFISERLNLMCESLCQRLSAAGLTGFRTVTITVRFSDFKTCSRSHTMRDAAGSASVLAFEALKLLMPFLDSRENPTHKLIRLIGLRIEKLN
ncbi:MAG TPA: DNA polymerase IV [Nitrospirales bacterium]